MLEGAAMEAAIGSNQLATLRDGERQVQAIPITEVMFERERERRPGQFRPFDQYRLSQVENLPASLSRIRRNQALANALRQRTGDFMREHTGRDKIDLFRFKLVEDSQCFVAL